MNEEFATLECITSAHTAQAQARFTLGPGLGHVNIPEDLCRYSDGTPWPLYVGMRIHRQRDGANQWRPVEPTGPFTCSEVLPDGRRLVPDIEQAPELIILRQIRDLLIKIEANTQPNHD